MQTKQMVCTAKRQIAPQLFASYATFAQGLEGKPLHHSVSKQQVGLLLLKGTDCNSSRDCLTALGERLV